MPFRFNGALRCPIDGAPLQEHQGSLRCAQAHSFDVARQGYVNLLSAQDKRSRDPGDSKAMVAARHRFLEAGHYQRIAESIVQTLSPHLQEGALIVDAGCGEGYYLQHLAEKMFETCSPVPAFLGYDVSKWALQAAARRFPATWLVASNRSLPLAEASADFVLDIFGFPQPAEFARVLKASGILLTVRAGDKHLLELRQLIYPQIRSKPNASSPLSGFNPLCSSRLCYQLPDLAQSAIQDLLLMTPHLFRATTEGKARLAALHTLNLTVDVCLDLYQKV